MKQTERPSKITATLKIIAAEFPADIVSSLEAYIEELEASQVSLLPDNNPIQIAETNSSPVWSHQRRMIREAHVHERNLKKLEHYYPK